jgi:membrane associated rhomboid family serine protease
MSLILIIVYFIFWLNLLDASFFVQVNPLVWEGWVWMLFTSLFLHANLLHLGGNVLFLLIFGTVLEEQVTRKRWLVTYFASGLTGNLAFLFLGPFLGQEIGLGASGAIYGLLGAAMGMKGTFVIIFLLGLDLFAGGGEIAHVAGLVVGLFIHRWGDSLAKALGPNSSNYAS